MKEIYKSGDAPARDTQIKNLDKKLEICNEELKKIADSVLRRK